MDNSSSVCHRRSTTAASLSKDAYVRSPSSHPSRSSGEFGKQILWAYTSRKKCIVGSFFEQLNRVCSTFTEFRMESFSTICLTDKTRRCGRKREREREKGGREWLLVRLTKQKRTWKINLPVNKTGYGTCRTAVLKALSSSGARLYRRRRDMRGRKRNRRRYT